MSRLATLATSVRIEQVFKTVLTFWQSELNGNMSGPMKTCVGPGGPHPMAVSEDSISGCVHVGRICTTGILHRPVLAGASYHCFITSLL